MQKLDDTISLMAREDMSINQFVIEMPPLYDDGSWDKEALKSSVDQALKSALQIALVKLYSERRGIYYEKIKNYRNLALANFDPTYEGKYEEYVILYNAELDQIWKICNMCKPKNDPNNK